MHCISPFQPILLLSQAPEWENRSDALRKQLEGDGIIIETDPYTSEDRRVLKEEIWDKFECVCIVWSKNRGLYSEENKFYHLYNMIVYLGIQNDRGNFVINVEFDEGCMPEKISKYVSSVRLRYIGGSFPREDLEVLQNKFKGIINNLTCMHVL